MLSFFVFFKASLSATVLIVLSLSQPFARTWQQVYNTYTKMVSLTEILSRQIYILISNQHYCDLAIDDIEEAWERRPLVCKVADFGESRSSEIQTNSILQSKTNRVNRGTPVYMAPEMLVEEMRLPVASAEDLKRADIWSFGMTLFVLLVAAGTHTTGKFKKP